MMTLMVFAGAVLFYLGFATMLCAMLFGSTSWSVLFLGTFQKASDYTTRGWWWYKTCVWCSVLGIALVIGGMLLH
ncbi:MAG: hypothetical protein R2712_26475 [Vicinamibacterales bacterium]